MQLTDTGAASYPCRECHEGGGGAPAVVGQTRQRLTDLELSGVSAVAAQCGTAQEAAAALRWERLRQLQQFHTPGE